MTELYDLRIGARIIYKMKTNYISSLTVKTYIFYFLIRCWLFCI